VLLIISPIVCCFYKEQIFPHSLILLLNGYI
jgi:hypothetical protein